MYGKMYENNQMIQMYGIFLTKYGNLYNQIEKNLVTTTNIDIVYLWHWDNPMPNGERI